MEANEEVLDIEMPDAEESGGESNFFEKRKLPDGVKKAFQSFLARAQTVNRSSWGDSVIVAQQQNGISFDDATKYASHFEDYHDQESGRKKQCRGPWINQANSFTNEELIAQAFDNEYSDPRNGVERLLEYVKQCHQYWKEKSNNSIISQHEKPYAPFFTLCQSSGWGKSRLLKELSRFLPLLYISFQDIRASGFPKRTEAAIAYLGKNGWKDLASRLIIAAQVLREKWGEDKQSDPNIISFDITKNGKFWEQLPEPGNDAKKIDSGSLVVVVFDEAAGMLTTDVKEKSDSDETTSLFLSSRRSLGETKELFGIYTDTSSKLANFAPQSHHDRSSRVSIGGAMLFHPFVPCHCMDAQKGKGPCMKGKNWMSTEWAISLGRPLWNSVFSFRTIDELLVFAADKLRIETHKEDDRQILALVLVRLGLFLSPVAPDTGLLVAEHMATALAINNDRSGILATYVSEPVLSLGASKSWRNKVDLSSKLLPALRKALMRGQVLEGSLGEIVATIVLLISMDNLTGTEPHKFFEWHPVEHFLKKLGTGWQWNQLKTGVPSNAQISVTHFIPWQRVFEESDLLKLAERRAGCIMKRNQDGVDLLIPLWWKAEDGAIKFGAILVQVKNCITHQDMKVVGYKMHPHYVFKEEGLRTTPYINIVMELGLNRAEKVAEKNRNTGANIVDVTTKALDGGSYEISATSSKKTLTVGDSIDLDNRKYSLFRLKGLKSIPFVQGDQALHSALNSLLLGPCDVKQWVQLNCSVKENERPKYDNDLSAMVEIGE